MTDEQIDSEIVSNLALTPVLPKDDKVAELRPSATPEQMRVVEVSTALEPAYQRASMLELTPEEIAALTAPFPDTDIEIRPNDGLIYISHILISDRLNKVLMPGKWALVCRRHWIDSQPGKDKYGKDKIIQTMYGEYVLLIRGCFVGESTGGHQYQPDNPKVNYSDTLESTAAEALRRIAGKRLSCGSQVWHPQYARDWKDKYAAKEGGDWVKRIPLASRNPPPAPKSHVPPPQSAPQPATAPNSPNPVEGVKSPEMPKMTQEKAKARMIELLAPLRDKAFAYFLFRDWIVDTQDIEDLPLERVPVNKAEMDMMLKCVQTFEIEGANGDYQQCESLASAEPWYDFVIPVPRKGQKRDEYLKNPETIGQLFDMRHGNDEESHAARQRLFGFLHHFEPTGWTKTNGDKMPPSEADKKFRLNLDLLADYIDKNPPDHIDPNDER